jgi:hypothetical protein
MLLAKLDLKTVSWCALIALSVGFCVLTAASYYRRETVDDWSAIQIRCIKVYLAISIFGTAALVRGYGAIVFATLAAALLSVSMVTVDDQAKQLLWFTFIGLAIGLIAEEVRRGSKRRNGFRSNSSNRDTPK